MDSVFTNLMLGFSVAMQPSVLAYAFAGCVIGTLVGMLPGLGPLAGISLLLPATFGLNPIVAIVLLDRKSTRLNSSHVKRSRMPSSA